MHGYVTDGRCHYGVEVIDRAEKLWQHFAFCAVYEDLKRAYEAQATVV